MTPSKVVAPPGGMANPRPKYCLPQYQLDKTPLSVIFTIMIAFF